MPATLRRPRFRELPRNCRTPRSLPRRSLLWSSRSAGASPRCAPPILRAIGFDFAGGEPLVPLEVQMVLRFASIRGVRTQHHVSRSRFFSSARTVLFRVNSVECTETLIGNTIRNPPSQSSKTPHGPSGKDLSCAPSQTNSIDARGGWPVSFMDFVPQHYKGIFVSQNYKGIPLYGFGQCLPGGWGYSPDCWAALPGLFPMWRINSLATSNCSP